MKELKARLLKRYIKTLNSNSKWYSEDIKTFKESIISQSEIQLKQRLSNMICLNGDSTSFNKEIEEIQSELDKGGMYNVNNMSGKSLLD